MSSAPANFVVEALQLAVALAEPGGISWRTKVAAWQRRLLLSRRRP